MKLKWNAQRNQIAAVNNLEYKWKILGLGLNAHSNVFHCNIKFLNISIIRLLFILRIFILCTQLGNTFLPAWVFIIIIYFVLPNINYPITTKLCIYCILFEEFCLHGIGVCFLTVYVWEFPHFAAICELMFIVCICCHSEIRSEDLVWKIGICFVKERVIIEWQVFNICHLYIYSRWVYFFVLMHVLLYYFVQWRPTKYLSNYQGTGKESLCGLVNDTHLSNLSMQCIQTPAENWGVLC